jgi:hypothetical protein
MAAQPGKTILEQEHTWQDKNLGEDIQADYFEKEMACEQDNRDEVQVLEEELEELEDQANLSQEQQIQEVGHLVDGVLHVCGVDLEKSFVGDEVDQPHAHHGDYALEYEEESS